VVHGATVGDSVLVGMKAVVLSHAQVGANTMIGACALVNERKQIPPGVLAVGLPAKAVRNLSEAERASIVDSAMGYCERARLHKASLQELEVVSE
jgi:carbonic anhydrase/acetyltransferase-like protein (isoleucine patch superfamily)